MKAKLPKDDESEITSEEEDEEIEEEKVKDEKKFKNEGKQEKKTRKLKDDSQSKKKKSSEPKNSVLIPILFSIVAIILFYIITPLSFNNRKPRIYLNFHQDSWDAFNLEAKTSLEMFHYDLKFDEKNQKAKVLQIETNDKHFQKLIDLVDELFPNREFQKFQVDATELRDSFKPDFFERYKEHEPLLVIVQNSHKVKPDVLLSLGSHMSNRQLIKSNGESRSAHNIGFLFIGASLPKDTISCNQINLLEHNIKKLNWKPTFVTRLSDQVKIC